MVFNQPIVSFLASSPLTKSIHWPWYSTFDVMLSFIPVIVFGFFECQQLFDFICIADDVEVESHLLG